MCKFFNSLYSRVVVGLWCGWAKLNVLQKRWLVWQLAALLILRSIGNLSSVVSTKVDV
jgi:hypothetical protein